MFSLAAVQQIGAAVLRVTIADGIPISKDSRGPNDVLNPLNWVLIGSQQVVIQAVKTVSGDPHIYDLVAESPIDTGTWRLATLAIKNVDGVSLLGQFVYFEAVDVQNFFTNPRDQQSSEDVLRQAMQVTDGPGWRAMIAALGRGDEIVREMADAAFHQMFLATAGGTYLERLTTSYGVDRPPDVGFDDDQIRKLTIALNANKIVGVALEAVLEAYYGIDATRIFAQSGIPEPFVLAVDQTLVCNIDSDALLITLDSNVDFVNIGSASAREVSVVLNRALAREGLRAYATPFTDPATGLVYVRLYSGIPGFRGRLQFFGGLIWDALKLPTEPSTTQAIGTQWSLQPSVPNSGIQSGRVRLTWIGGPTPNIQTVFTGDYVNIFGAPFDADNRGVFRIADTTATWVEYEYDADIPPVAQGSVTQTGARDVFFVRPQLITPSSRLFAAVTRAAPERAEILLPATTAAVTRSLNRAWYLNGSESQGVTAGSRSRGSTSLMLTTALPHGLVAGDHFFLDDVVIDYTWTLPTDVISAPTYGAVYIEATVELRDGRLLVIDYDKNYSIFSPATRTWTTPAATGFTGAGIAPHMGACLMADGRVFAALRNQARIYDADLDVWVGAAAPPRDKYFTQTGIMRLRDDRIIVIADDLLGGTGTWSDIYDPQINAWADPLLITNSPAMLDPVCQITPSGNIALAGGGSGIEARTFYYNADEKTWRQIDTLPQPLFGGNMIFVPQGPGGQFWLTGVNGAASLYNEIYVLDLTTLTWSIRTTAQNFIWGTLTKRGDQVFMASGFNYTGPAVSWEIHDFTMPGATGKRVIPGTTTTTATEQPFLVVLSDGSIMLIGQQSRASQLYLLYAADRQRSAGRLDGEYEVATVGLPTQITFITDSDVAVAIASASLTPVLAGEENLRSGYCFDIKDGVALASGETLMTVAIHRGPTEGVLAVADTSDFPDAPGYIVLNFGTATQSQTLRYLGIASATQLRIAAGQILLNDYAIDTPVSLVIGTGPYAPQSAAALGASYLTASSVGRIEAVKDLEFSQASGLLIAHTVLYPGDRGLGNAGDPTSGAQKLSDAVIVWGGDDVDAELAGARL